MRIRLLVFLISALLFGYELIYLEDRISKLEVLTGTFVDNEQLTIDCLHKIINKQFGR